MPRARRQSTTPAMPLWAETLPDDFLICRDLGHVWRPHTAAWDGTHNVYNRALRCGRCHAVRHQTLSAQGHPLTASYDYPEGYLAPAGQGVLGTAERDTLRLVSVTRFMDSEPLRRREGRRR